MDEILRHAVSLAQDDPHIEIPFLNVLRAGRGAGQYPAGVCQTKLLSDACFLLVGQRGLRGRRNFGVDAFFELDPQSRHGEEERRLYGTQFLCEGRQFL